jgi:hypothetical protein
MRVPSDQLFDMVASRALRLVQNVDPNQPARYEWRAEELEGANAEQLIHFHATFIGLRDGDWEHKSGGIAKVQNLLSNCMETKRACLVTLVQTAYNTQYAKQPANKLQ